MGALQRTGVLATLITELTVSSVALKLSTHPHSSWKILSAIPARPAPLQPKSLALLYCILNHQSKDLGFLQENKQGSCVCLIILVVVPGYEHQPYLGIMLDFNLQRV